MPSMTFSISPECTCKNSPFGMDVDRCPIHGDFENLNADAALAYRFYVQQYKILGGKIPLADIQAAVEMSLALLQRAK